jgi:LysR family transcriptional regulator, benzoate and cis,cis-muconate-responsive activator of ben and cat genes
MPRHNFELRRLSYFIGVAEQGGMRAAAKALHVSQPPLSRQIQLLEDELGVELFVRGSGGSMLTQAGQRFYAHAKRIEALTTQAAEEARMVSSGLVGRLDIGIFGSAVFSTIPRIVQTFRAEYPDVRVVLHNLDRESQLKGLREHHLDAGFNWFFPGDAEIARLPMLKEDLVVAVFENHPLAGSKSVELGQLRDEAFVLFPRVGSPNFADHVIHMCRQSGFELAKTEIVDDVVTAIALVSCGFGICIAVASASALMAPGVRFIPLGPASSIPAELCLYTRRNDESAQLAAFRLVASSYCNPLHQRTRP